MNFYKSLLTGLALTSAIIVAEHLLVRLVQPCPRPDDEWWLILRYMGGVAAILIGLAVVLDRSAWDLVALFVGAAGLAAVLSRALVDRYIYRNRARASEQDGDRA